MKLENKEEYWVNDKLEIVLDKEFKDKLDGDESWAITNQLKYEAFVHRNMKISDDDMSILRTYLTSSKSFKELLILDKIITKNLEKYNTISSLNQDYMKGELGDIYREHYKIPKDYIDNHVKTDMEEYSKLKLRNEKLKELLDD